MIPNNELDAIINDTKLAIQERRRLNYRHIARTNSLELHHRQLQAVFDDEMCGKIRLATKDDYMAWLRIHLESGGKITNVYNYPMDLHSWIVATQDFEEFPLYGALSKQIIVAENVNVKRGSTGHNILYCVNSPTYKSHFVPVYTDTIFDLMEELEVQRPIVNIVYDLYNLVKEKFFNFNKA
ncbi:MAG: hypothetical protein KAJ19_23790 [Gammaproteobacteria bacterium]|nr:hypothetical protein [Gammaproteobacteria bacterium]